VIVVIVGMNVHACRAENGVVFHGGGRQRDEIAVVVTVIAVIASVGSTGCDDESFWKE
jgi:hypothetical protein